MKRIVFLILTLISFSTLGQNGFFSPTFDTVRFRGNRGKVYELITYGDDSIRLNGQMYRFTITPATNYWQPTTGFGSAGKIQPKPRNKTISYPGIQVWSGSSSPAVSSPVWWRSSDSTLRAYSMYTPDLVSNNDTIAGCEQVYLYEPPSVSDAIIYIDSIVKACGCFTIKNNGPGSELTVISREGLLIDDAANKVLTYGDVVTICPAEDRFITTFNTSDETVDLWANAGGYIYNSNTGNIFTSDSILFGNASSGGYITGDTTRSTLWMGLKDWYLLRIKDAPITQRRLIPRLTQTFKAPYTSTDLEEMPNSMYEYTGGYHAPSTINYHPVWLTTYASVDTLDFGQTIWGHWIAAASPKGEFGTQGGPKSINAFNTVGMEIDCLNRYKDEGYREEPLVYGDTAGKWTRTNFGLQIIPENRLNMVGPGGSYEHGFNCDAAIMIGHSPARSGWASARWHTPIYINSDATTHSGTSIVIGGGSVDSLSPNIGIKFLNYHVTGIDFSGATCFKESVVKTSYSQTFTDGVTTKTLSQLAHDSLLNMENRVIVSLDSALRLHGNSTVFKTLTHQAIPSLSGGAMFYDVLDSLYVEMEYVGADTSNAYYINFNIPSDYKEGSTVYPKVRYKYTATDGVPVFYVKYRWINNGGSTNVGWSWVRLTSNTGTTNHTTQYNYNSSGISGSGKTVNSMLQCKFYLVSKLGSMSDVIPVYDFGLQYESDALGANTLTSKD